MERPILLSSFQVELREPHSVRAVHDQGVRRGYVEPALDDGGRGQAHRPRPSSKCFITSSRARSGICPCAATKRTPGRSAQPLCDVVYSLHTVVDEEGLALAGDLPLYGPP